MYSDISINVVCGYVISGIKIELKKNTDVPICWLLFRTSLFVLGLMLHPPQNECVVLRVEVTLARQEVQSEEAVISPTLPDLEVGRKLPYDVLRGVSRCLVDHFNAVLVFRSLRETGAQFQEYGEVVPPHDTIAIRIDLETPAESVDV